MRRLSLLTALVLTNNIRIEMLYVFALAFGLADAFYFPGPALSPSRLMGPVARPSPARRHG